MKFSIDVPPNLTWLLCLQTTSDCHFVAQAQSNLVTFHTELVADLDAIAVRRSFMQCALIDARTPACSRPLASCCLHPAAATSIIQSAVIRDPANYEPDNRGRRWSVGSVDARRWSALTSILPMPAGSATRTWRKPRSWLAQTLAPPCAARAA